MAKSIRIDLDIWNDAAQYVCAQFAIMEKYESLAPQAKTYEGWADTVYRVATYLQMLRNLQRRLIRPQPKNKPRGDDSHGAI